MLDALLAAYKLKHTARAGWLRVGVQAPESVASHSWGLSLLVLALLPPELDRGRALTYATLHDVAESLAGDITPHDGVSERDKAVLERSAVHELSALGLPPDLAALWQAYEAQADAEARFVRELDRLDMAIQACCYADRAEVGAFFESAARVVRDPALVALLNQARERAR